MRLQAAICLMFQVYVQVYNSSDEEDRIILKDFKIIKSTSIRLVKDDKLIKPMMAKIESFLKIDFLVLEPFFLIQNSF
jgi:hypothetical protein